jgi:hypothetical protein
MAAFSPKPLETHYNGYRFRSRLEARWAVFFDTAGIPYRYEPEGFDLGGVWYLPDFWLPDQQVWVEIKATVPTEEVRDKARRLAAATGRPVALFFGDCWVPAGRHGNGPAVVFLDLDVELKDHAWSQCLGCGRLTINLLGAQRCSACGGQTRHDAPRLTTAFRAARGRGLSMARAAAAPAASRRRRARCHQSSARGKPRRWRDLGRAGGTAGTRKPPARRRWTRQPSGPKPA